MRVYVASSWRNEQQPGVVYALREAGHNVYDFRNPREGDHGFHWSDIDPGWQSWTPEQYREALSHPIAQNGFASDMDALKECDAVVGVQPFGRSASLELGWACGAGKLTVLLLDQGEPELMVAMCDHICLRVIEVLSVLEGFERRRLVQRRYQKLTTAMNQGNKQAEGKAETTLLPSGDEGQRYEVRALDSETRDEILIGWADDPAGLEEMVELHPGLTKPRVIDRTTQGNEHDQH